MTGMAKAQDSPEEVCPVMVEKIPESGAWGPRLWLVTGFLVYLAVQGYLLISPLRHWTLVPETDDTLTYVLKSRQMQECFHQNCPALVDLKQQFTTPLGDPGAAREQALASSRVFPVYHPLFSLLLIAISQLGLSLMEAYRLLWCLAPGIFGLALAVFLISLVGPGPAAVALLLLAFKVFPDTGLHHLVPSNFTMALAVVLWARLIARRGRAPWCLFLGSLVLIGFHLVGFIYAAVAVLLALSLAAPEDRRRLLLPVMGVAAGSLAYLWVPPLFGGPAWAVPPLLPRGERPLQLWLLGVGQNLAQVVVDNVRLAGGLWGSLPLFLGALVLGWVTLPRLRRPAVNRMLAIYGLVLGALVFYVSYHPADVLFRVWIPPVVVLFGLVGQGFWYALEAFGAWWQKERQGGEKDSPLTLARLWPALLLALMLGYVTDMVIKGGEQVGTMARYLRERQPLALFPEQPELLLSRARPGDRVLYTSIIALDYYLIHGALKLGAVYYHPTFKNSVIEKDWLTRPELRFVVAFQPTVYHPSFEGVSETSWWITQPEFRFSPLSRRRQHGPAAREGKIPAALYRNLTIKVGSGFLPKALRLFLENPKDRGLLEIVPLDPGGAPLRDRRREIQVPARFQGWLTADLNPLPPGATLMIGFPRETDRFSLGGLTFGESQRRWPWAQKAQLTFHPREGGSPPFTVSFDPRDLLPEPLRTRSVTVLDDQGSTVLLELN